MSKENKVSQLPKKEEEKTAPPETKKPAEKSSVKTYTLHNSVKNLFKAYPQLRMPAITLKCDINPSVIMELDAVENYFKVRELNIDRYVQKTSKTPKTVAIKSTSAPSKRLTKNPFSATDIIARRISNKVIKNHPDPEPPNLLKEPSKRDRKRKRPFSPSTTPKILKKPLIEDSVSTTSSLSPVPSNFSEDFSDVCGIAKKSHELHVCNICNSVHYHAKELKKHLIKHLYCQFCKRKFKTMEIKEEHIESSCKIQKAMKGMTILPDVYLVRVELDKKIIQKYAKALIELEIKNDVIEIESDKENKNKKESPIIKDEPNNFTRPKIEITDGLLNKIVLDNSHSTDVKLLKTLLSSYNKNLKKNVNFNKKVSSQTQTILPTNELIKTHREDGSIEMQAIIQQLHYYKIPMQIKYGTIINACYKYDCRNDENKVVEHWDDLIPIDLPNESNQVSSLQDYIKSEELFIDDIHHSLIIADEEIDDDDDNDVDIEGIELVDMETDQNITEGNNHLTEPAKSNDDNAENELDIEGHDSVNMEIIENVSKATSPFYNRLIVPTQINTSGSTVNCDSNFCQKDLIKEINNIKDINDDRQLFTSTETFTLKDAMSNIDRNKCNRDAADTLKESSVPNGDVTEVLNLDNECSSSQDDCFDEIRDARDRTKENGCGEKLHDKALLIKEDGDVLYNSRVSSDNGGKYETNPFADPLFFAKETEMNLDVDDSNSPVRTEESYIATSSHSNESSNSFPFIRVKTVFELTQ